MWLDRVIHIAVTVTLIEMMVCGRPSPSLPIHSRTGAWSRGPPWPTICAFRF